MSESTSPRPFPDFNGNGVPDYREGWFWRTTWGVFSTLVRTFASSHTLIYRAVEAAETFRGAVNAGATHVDMIATMPDGAGAPPGYVSTEPHRCAQDRARPDADTSGEA